MKDKVLLVGGGGFIGSHTGVALSEAGIETVVLDNFSTSDTEILSGLQKILRKSLPIEVGDARDSRFVQSVLRKHNITAVVHFAAYKSIAESIKTPIRYFRNNLESLTSVLEAMEKVGCYQMIFSSTAAVYDASSPMPVSEISPIKPSSPYALSKRTGEEILLSLHRLKPEWKIAILRYFNPVGAHPSGFIGETPKNFPTNLMPRLCDVAIGVRKEFQIFGTDFATPDGTGIRDFIHVMDLAEGHVSAFRSLDGLPFGSIINLGTGLGHSVRDVLAVFEKVSGRVLNVKVMPRRAGDAAECWADSTKAQTLLGWNASRSLEEMCRDAWNWRRRCGC